MLEANFMLAVTEGMEWVAPLIQTGAVGGVLIWFMFRCEPRLVAIEKAIDRMARSILLLVISSPLNPPQIKNQGEAINAELDEAARARKKPET